MYKKFNTRKQLTRRILGYVFMVSAIVIGVAGATAWTMGYRYDLLNKSLARVALLQFQSSPGGADIYLDDKKLDFRTPGRSDKVDPGANTVKYTLENYRDWSKTVNLKPAEVRWLNYARLVPKDIETKTVADLGNFDQALAAPNGDYILLHETPASRAFKLIDISDSENIQITDLELSKDLANFSDSSRLSIVEWDSSSNFVLLEHVSGDKHEILRLNRRNVKDSLNLTELFGTNLSSPHFLNNNNNVIFALTGSGVLRRLEINSKTISAPLVEKVEKYDIYGDGKLTYVGTNDKSKQIVGIYYKDKNYVLREFDTPQTTFASFLYYYHSEYLAIARSDALTIIVSPFAEEKTEISVEVSSGIDYLTYNGSSRFIVVGRGDAVTTYDLETSEAFQFKLSGLNTKPKWIDDYHLAFVDQGKMQMVEFDGGNQEALVKSLDFAVFSSNNRYLFSLEKSNNGVKLNRSTMILENNFWNLN